MARPSKVGLDYFPHDCEYDAKFNLVHAQHPDYGHFIICSLWQSIYKEEGYYKQWEERDQILFSHAINRDRDRISQVLEECFKWGLFDAEKHEKYGIITSSGVQKRYFEAVKKRKKVEIIEEYLIDGVEMPSNAVIIDIPDGNRNPLTDGVNVELTRVNAELTTPDRGLMNHAEELSTQSKVDKSKVNQSKEKGDHITDANASEGAPVNQLIIDQVEQTEEKPKKKPTLKAWERRAKKSEGFQQFVSEYPEHRSLGGYRAFLAWERQGIDGDPELLEKTMKWLRSWIASDDWTKDGGKYVPNMDKFMNEYWDRKPAIYGGGNQGNTWGASAMNQYRREQKQKGEKGESVTEPYDVQFARILAEEEKQRQRVAESQRRLREREDNAGA